MSDRAIGTFLCLSAGLSLIVQCGALFILYHRRPRPGLIRTVVCRIFASMLYIGVGTLAIVNSDPPGFVGLFTITAVQFMWQLNSILDVYLTPKQRGAHRRRGQAMTEPTASRVGGPAAEEAHQPVAPAATEVHQASAEDPAVHPAAVAPTPTPDQHRHDLDQERDASRNAYDQQRDASRLAYDQERDESRNALDKQRDAYRHTLDQQRDAFRTTVDRQHAEAAATASREPIAIGAGGPVRVFSLAEATTALLAQGDAITHGAEERKHLRNYLIIIGAFVALYAFVVVAVVVNGYRLASVTESNTRVIAELQRQNAVITQLLKRQDLSIHEQCALYSLFLPTYSDRAKSIYPQGPTAYDQAFRALQVSSDHLSCGLAHVVPGS